MGSFLTVTSIDIQEFERKTDGLKGETAVIIRLIGPCKFLNKDDSQSWK